MTLIYPLLGTWRLKSHVGTTDAGARLTPYGEHPTGYLSYSADGRMQVIGTAGGRIARRGAEHLYESMFAYAGTYTVEAGKVVHHVDISWNEAWTGTDQVRFYELKGNILVIRSSVMNPDGAQTHYVVVWERVEGPR